MSESHIILGGCGFIGRHVALLLARQGIDVTLADRAPPSWSYPEDVAPRIVWCRFELASADWDRVVGCADVIHLYAWTSIPATANANPAGDLNANVVGMLGLLEAMKRHPGKRLVFTSSGGTVYGNLQHVPVSEDHAFDPVTAYGASKATAEIYLRLYHALHGVDCRIARISNAYGAGQDLSRGQGAATVFLHRALIDQPIVIWGDGRVVRDYVHIADVASALVTMSQATMEKGMTTFNIGSGQGISLNDMLTEIEGHLARKLTVIRGPPRSFDLPVNVLDITRARSALGWVPRFSFTQGIRQSILDLVRGDQLSSLHIES